MHTPSRLPFVVASAVLWRLAVPTAPAAAQDHDHTAGMDRLGTVEFPVSCAPEAQARFTHAVAVLHSFWWEEGDRAFDAVLEADSTCAMAWWGKAMNAWNNPFAGGPTGAALQRGAAAAERAAASGARTPRERGFIGATGALYRNAAVTTNAARLQAYADTMARLYRDFPADVEVAIYHALALVATASRSDTTFARQKQAAAILNPLFAAHPDHPGLAHYLIHSNDAPALAHLGLDAARRYAQIAPAAPHAQHMPSHIFVRLGLWDETVAANWRSYQAGVDYAKALGKAEVAPHELHALDYAVYGNLQRGRDSAAAAAAALARSIATSGIANTLIGGYNGTALQARIPLERGDWTAAAAFPVHEAPDVPLVTALSRFTRGIGAARSGMVAQARTEVAALDSITRLLDSRDPYWARVVGIKRDAVWAWVRLADADTAGALALAHAAAALEDETDKHPVTPAELLPARELEADMLLALGHYAEARAAYQATLAREPGRARSTFGAARAAELARDRTQAMIGYRAFLELMGGGDGERAELQVARAYLARTVGRGGRP